MAVRTNFSIVCSVSSSRSGNPPWINEMSPEDFRFCVFNGIKVQFKLLLPPRSNRNPSRIKVSEFNTVFVLIFLDVLGLIRL